MIKFSCYGSLKKNDCHLFIDPKMTNILKMTLSLWKYN